MAEIRIDYTNARAQVRKLREAAEQCADVIRDLQTTERDLSGCWVGESADAYALGLQKRISEIRKIQEDALELAALIQRAADEFEEAERRTKEAMEMQFA